MDDHRRAVGGAGQNSAYRPVSLALTQAGPARIRAAHPGSVGMQIVHVLTLGDGQLVDPMQLVPNGGALMQDRHIGDAVGRPEGHSMRRSCMATRAAAPW